MSKYTCEQCEKEVDDNGPYERSDGEYECQDCMEQAQACRELRAEQSLEDALADKGDEELHRRRENGEC